MAEAQQQPAGEWRRHGTLLIPSMAGIGLVSVHGYSLGVMIFELATGQLPFRKGNVPYHHVHTAPPDPKSIKADIPDGLGAVILRCLQKAPAERFQSAKELLEELERLARPA